MFECVINVSEGRDERVLSDLERAAGASLRDRHSDAFHHRSVFTLINSSEALLGDGRELVVASYAALDLSTHRGVHPRLGVVDVVPFVALEPDAFADAVALRDDTARWIASLGVPVFLYGPTEDGERSLPYVRAHAFADLAPDFGPDLADARRGAAVVGARALLVAWNLWLRDTSLAETQRVARLARGAGVRTLALEVGEMTQVSCNLFDLALARPSAVYDLVAEELREGVIDHAELVGLAPRSLLASEDPRRWAQLGLSEDATIESRLAGRA